MGTGEKQISSIKIMYSDEPLHGFWNCYYLCFLIVSHSKDRLCILKLNKNYKS